VRIRCAALVGAVVLTLQGPGSAQDATGFVERSHPAIQYGSTATTDPVSRVQEGIASGRIRLDDAAPIAYLKSLLRAMNMSGASQMMVFSQTSLQRALIAPSNPRALYFNDAVSVGWVPGGVIEIASQDPVQGVHFYSVDPRVHAPAIVRRNDCLYCHHSYRTNGVPGMIEPMTHRRALEMRWGGWYVTGVLGTVRHLGNVDPEAPPREATSADFNWPSLQGRVDTSRYPSPYSDVGALMVFEHQMRMMNLLTRANWDARIAEREPTAESQAVLREDIDAIVDYMLFVDEAPIPSPIASASGFVNQFSTQGPFDTRGRSLRQLDLRTRLLKFPCSYMIYSEQFDRLPAGVKSAIYAGLSDVLTGKDRTGRFDHLSGVDRIAILEILRDTKRDLPAGFGVV
jgi:hypothetical protein